MRKVSIAVGCAVGIPIGLSFLVAIAFWIRMQRSHKKEEKRDRELENVIRDDGGFISFDNLESWREQQVDKKDFYVNDASVDSSGNHASSSSEQLQQPNEGQPEKNQSKHYVPAYRRNLNAYRVRQTLPGVNSNDGSKVSLDSTQAIRKTSNQTHESVYDQMIPILASTEPKLFSGENSEENTTATLQQNQQNNEKIIMKNIRNNDFGSYPKRTQSMSSLSGSNSNANTNVNVSRSSLHTKSSSSMSIVKRTASEDNAFDIPKSVTAVSPVDGKDSSNQQLYSLKNNYDIRNTSEIQEEDQYENEFTNYSESKRQFIDSLRPKPGL